jgi:hypothetical protein
MTAGQHYQRPSKIQPLKIKENQHESANYHQLG